MIIDSIGIPWVFDVISAAVEHNDGSGESFGARLSLDILNLLTVSQTVRIVFILNLRV